MTSPKRLGYSRPIQCCAHEVAPGSGGPAEAEIIVAGYSFCYPCGNGMLGNIIEKNWTVPEMLRMVRDGVIEVAP
jgi:hypothetical protein